MSRLKETEEVRQPNAMAASELDSFHARKDIIVAILSEDEMVVTYQCQFPDLDGCVGLGRGKSL